MGNLVRLTPQFREELQQRMRARDNMSPSDLSRASGVSKQNISRILNDTKHSTTGAPPRTEQETIEKIADALNWPRHDALRLLGIRAESLTPTEVEKRMIENLLFRRRKLTPKRKRDFDNFIRMLDNQIDGWEMEDKNGA